MGRLFLRKASWCFCHFILLSSGWVRFDRLIFVFFSLKLFCLLFLNLTIDHILLECGHASHPVFFWKFFLSHSVKFRTTIFWPWGNECKCISWKSFILGFALLMTLAFAFIKLVHTIIFLFSTIFESVIWVNFDNVERRHWSSLPGLLIGLVQLIVFIN